MLDRILNNLQIRKRARKFKVKFATLKYFKVPQKMFIHDKWVNISYPNENGMWSAFVEIFLQDGYQLSTLQDKKIKNVVDVGANVGFFSIAARSFFPDAHILAYEPNKELDGYLATNLKQVNVKYHLEAVGKIDTYVSLNIKNTDSIMTSVIEDPASAIKQVSIKGIVDKINAPIDLLKLDCEGSEWDILEDVATIQKVRFIVMEYHIWARKGKTEEDIISLLEKCNFSVIKMKRDVGFGFIMAANKAS